MNKNILTTAAAILCIFSLTSCGRKVAHEATAIAVGNESSVPQLLPKAKIYKTNGDYNNNVPITLSADGKRVISFPAPSDLSANSTPLQLADGFLLDRRGISPNSAFLTLTYNEYAALKQAPSPSELLKLVIPEAKVTEIILLPFTIGSADDKVADINKLIQSGLQDCEKMFP